MSPDSLCLVFLGCGAGGVGGGTHVEGVTAVETRNISFFRVGGGIDATTGVPVTHKGLVSV